MTLAIRVTGGLKMIQTPGATKCMETKQEEDTSLNVI